MQFLGIKDTVKQSTNRGCPTIAQRPVDSVRSRRTPVRTNTTSPVRDGNSRESVTLMLDRTSYQNFKEILETKLNNFKEF